LVDARPLLLCSQNFCSAPPLPAASGRHRPGQSESVSHGGGATFVSVAVLGLEPWSSPHAPALTRASAARRPI